MIPLTDEMSSVLTVCLCHYASKDPMATFRDVYSKPLVLKKILGHLPRQADKLTLRRVNKELCENFLFPEVVTYYCNVQHENPECERCWTWFTDRSLLGPYPEQNQLSELVGENLAPGLFVWRSEDNQLKEHMRFHLWNAHGLKVFQDSRFVHIYEGTATADELRFHAQLYNAVMSQPEIFRPVHPRYIEPHSYSALERMHAEESGLRTSERAIREEYRSQEQHDKEATTTSSLPATTDEEEVPPSSVCATEDEDEVLASQNEEHEEEEQQHVSSTSGEEPHPSTSMGSVSASLANDGTPPPRTRARMSTGPWWGR